MKKEQHEFLEHLAKFDRPVTRSEMHKGATREEDKVRMACKRAGLVEYVGGVLNPGGGRFSFGWRITAAGRAALAAREADPSYRHPRQRGRTDGALRNRDAPERADPPRGAPVSPAPIPGRYEPEGTDINAVAKTIEHEPQTTALAAITPMEMLDRAITSGASVETLEKLMSLQERWEKNQARKAFDDAMAEAKAEIPVISKNRTVDFTSSKGRTHYRHEDLAEVARTVNPILSKHGLSYRFKTQSAPNEPIVVTCIVSHRLGYFEENTLTAGRDDSGNKNHIQQIGSTLTYLQRMTLKAALGLAAAEDDDGKKSEDTSGPISDEQVKTVRALIEATETDIAKFCEYLKVEAVPDIPSREYQRAIAMLEKKRDRK